MISTFLLVRALNYVVCLVWGGGTARPVMEEGMQERRGRERPKEMERKGEGNWMGNLRKWNREGGWFYSEKNG